MKAAYFVAFILAVTTLFIAPFDSPKIAAAQNGCVLTFIESSSVTGEWTSDCLGRNRVGPGGVGEYYARYYGFRVLDTSEVTITLESSTDTYLYLLAGAGIDGAIIALNDDIDIADRNFNSRITTTLIPGDYSIEATTFSPRTAGEFTLSVAGIETLKQDDRAALTAFYHATGGDNWRDNNNWLTDAPLSEWAGVSTDQDGKVIRLNFYDNNLSGNLPPEIGNLSELEELYLNYDKLAGTIPPEIGKLTNLESLWLYGNNLTGAIPPEIGNLSELEELYLYSNSLEGAIPPEIGNLSRLEKLHLSDNKLDGQIPPELSRLTSLLVLSLDSNELDGQIPFELGSLYELEELALSLNNLTGTIPYELGKLTNLESLSLYGNNLTGSIPPELGNLANLQSLRLFENNLTGSIPPVLGNLTNLTVLNVSHNELTGTIPPELSKLTNLIEIDLHTNPLSGEIPPALGSLPNLEKISFTENGLTGEIPAELGSLPKLKLLGLGGNNLSGEIPPELADIETLTELYLWDNELTAEAFLPRLREMQRLEAISIGGNPIAGTEALAEVVHLPNLWILYLHDTQITSEELIPYIGKLTGLERLSLGQNLLTGDRVLPMLAELDNLTALDVSENQLTGEIPAALGDTNIDRLFLDHNQLTGKAPPELGNLGRLKYLRLNDNSLTGTLPQSLTQIRVLEIHFHNNAGLCAPANDAFQEWLKSIREYEGPTCEETAQQQPPKPAQPECTQHTSADARISGVWTDNCVSRSRDRDDDHYARYFTFTLDSYTTIEVTMESSVDSYIFLLDSDNEILFQNDDYINRNAGFLTTLEPGSYTIEATTYYAERGGDFTLTLRMPELDALRALYDATDGANWENNDNWLSDAPLSEWHGVKTDDKGRVTQIYLNSNNLTGTLPRELGDLNKLEWLFLAKNNLSGEIPRELGKLFNMKTLLLADNELTGGIPAQLGNMTELQELWLGRNSLSGEIPASLGRLENLRGLYLTLNDLSGEIPEELSELSNLRTLSIGGNNLSGRIPHQLTRLENLTHIYLWGNDLIGASFIRDLDNLESLQFLDIGGNAIVGANVLAELGDLPNLTGLGLHDSDLSDADLRRYMNDLQALELEFLNIRSNGLSDPQTLIELSRITSIQRLAINDNRFAGELPRTMTALKLMRVFHFQDNDGLCAPADNEFQSWLSRIGDHYGDTCAGGVPANAPAPAPSGEDRFASIPQSPERLPQIHSIVPMYDLWLGN